MNKIVIALLMLLSGLIAYYIFRPSIILFDIIHIQQLQSSPQPTNIFYRFCSNHVSDICWGVFINLSALWMDEKSIPVMYRYSILSIPFIYELGLSLHVIAGTFDVVDLFFYTIIFLFVYNPFNLKLHAKI